MRTDAISGLRDIEEFTMFGNSIRNFNCHSIEDIVMTLSSFAFFGNGFYCDCGLAWLWSLDKALSGTMTQIIQDNNCYGPKKYFKIKSLKEFNVVDLQCGPVSCSEIDVDSLPERRLTCAKERLTLQPSTKMKEFVPVTRDTQIPLNYSSETRKEEAVTSLISRLTTTTGDMAPEKDISSTSVNVTSGITKITTAATTTHRTSTESSKTIETTTDRLWATTPTTDSLDETETTESQISDSEKTSPQFSVTMITERKEFSFDDSETRDRHSTHVTSIVLLPTTETVRFTEATSSNEIPHSSSSQSTVGIDPQVGLASVLMDTALTSLPTPDADRGSATSTNTNVPDDTASTLSVEMGHAESTEITPPSSDQTSINNVTLKTHSSHDGSKARTIARATLPSSSSMTDRTSNETVTWASDRTSTETVTWASDRTSTETVTWASDRTSNKTVNWVGDQTSTETVTWASDRKLSEKIGTLSGRIALEHMKSIDTSTDVISSNINADISGEITTTAEVHVMSQYSKSDVDGTSRHPSTMPTMSDTEMAGVNMGESSGEVLRSIEKSVVDKFEGLETNMSTIKDDLYGAEGLENRIQHIAGQSEGKVGELEIMRKENKNLKEELALVKALLIKLDRKVDIQSAQIVDLKSREMRNNIIIQNIPENQGEDLIQACMSIFENDLGLSDLELKNLQVVRVHRTGTYSAQRKYPRPVVINFGSFKQKENVLHKAQDKKNKLESGAKLYSQFPEEIREKRRRLFEVHNDYTEKGIVTKVAFDKLIFNNGTVYRERVKIPRAEDLLEEREQRAVDMNIETGDRVEDSGTTFLSTATCVKSINEVRRFTRQVMKDPQHAKSAYNTVVYRYRDEDDKVHEGYDDEGNAGTGNRVMKWLKKNEISGMAILVTVMGPAQYLGWKPRRYQLALQSARSAISKLKDKRGSVM